MPTCSAVSLRPLSLKTCSQDVFTTIRRKSKIPNKLSYARRSRLASTAAALQRRPQTTNSVNTAHAPRPTPLTTLHRATSFLLRVLPSRARSDVLETESLEFWEELLNKAQDGLSTPKTSKDVARIVVYGYGEHSCAQDLVNALLEEPFTSDASKRRIEERWKSVNKSGSLSVRYGPTTEAEDDELYVQSSWLQQFPVPVEIQELPSSTRTPSHTAALFAADIPVVVCNPLTTPLQSLFADVSIPWNHANTILVVTSSSNTSIPPSLTQAIRSSAPKSLTILFVDPARALSALQTLRADPNSTYSIQRYQDGFSESGVPDTSAAISQKLAAFSATSGGDILHTLRNQNSLELVSDSLTACRKAVKIVEREADKLRAGVSGLQSQIEEFKAKIGSDVFGREDQAEVKEALERAKRDVKETMDRLTGWRLLWKVDDIADTVNACVDRAWCRGLESNLVFRTGRLSVTQNFLAGAANALLSSFPKSSPFFSLVLQNILAQHRSQPTYPVNPTSLTPPLYTRRTQLTYPTNNLHRSAQRVVVGISGSVLGGIGVAWTGWAEQLGILGGLGLGLGAETAAGLGMFSAVAGVWYAMGRWEKAKKRWWRDWDRVGDGLERDLRATLDRTVIDQVLIIPSIACEGLREMIAKRADEVAQLKDEIAALEQDSIPK